MNNENTIDKINFFNEFHFKNNAPGIGLQLYKGNEYLGTYMSYKDCICDLAFRHCVGDLQIIKEIFNCYGKNIEEPYKYRGVCTEMFWPTEKISSYICYSNSMQELLAKMELHEQRAISNPKHFEFGVKGTGIHLFDKEKKQYIFWIGGNSYNNIADIISQAHKENKLIPSELIQEMEELNDNKTIDVFISHKSNHFLKSKKVYDSLISTGFSCFLSEISLPALSNTDYSFEIDNALEKAKNIVVIATSKEAVLSGWVKYEWSTFANEKRSNRKTGNIITVIDDTMDIADLPLLLRQYEVINFEQLDLLSNFLKK